MNLNHMVFSLPFIINLKLIRNTKLVVPHDKTLSDNLAICLLIDTQVNLIF